ncbi:MAG TPA: hypothetical protein VLH94_02025 [Spirochaetia bacterium]|nr:hypothetical protein [Spirochaetia bacterium]
MEQEEYFQKILKLHKVDNDGEEMKEIQSTKEEVEAIILGNFEDSSPTIRYGGSKAKNTMIIDSYDLDMVCYFNHNDNSAGTSLKEIYENIKNCFADNYIVEPKKSAIRLISKDTKKDLHIDVVPGRYVDDTKTYSYIFQAEGEKERMKTNLDVHIKNIRDSGLTDVVKLVKLWNIRMGLNLKTFILELLVVKYAKKYKDDPLSKGLISFWEFLRDHEDFSIEDPANPEGNDLSQILNQDVRQFLSMSASNVMTLVDNNNLDSIFGSTEPISGEEKTEAIKTVFAGYSDPPKPWSSSYE